MMWRTDECAERLYGSRGPTLRLRVATPLTGAPLLFVNGKAETIYTRGFPHYGGRVPMRCR